MNQVSTQSPRIQEPMAYSNHSRLANLLFLPANPIVKTIQGTAGLVMSTAAIATGGKFARLNTLAFTNLQRFQYVVAAPYFNLLKFINLNEFDIMRNGIDKPTSKEVKTGERYLNIYSHNEGEGKFKTGIFTGAMGATLTLKGHKLHESKNFLARHVASRLTFGLLAISCVVTRVAELALACLALPFSILLLGKAKGLNQITFRGLQVTGILNDLLFCVLKIINPGAKGNDSEVTSGHRAGSRVVHTRQQTEASAMPERGEEAERQITEDIENK